LKLLFIDIDNTIGNLISHYLKEYNKQFNASFNITHPETFNTYSFPEYTKFESSSYEEELEKMYKIFNTENFWKTIPLIDYADEVIKELNNIYDIYLLTSPSFKSPYFFNERLNWVEEKLPFFDYHKIIFCENKGMFKTRSILIDDMPKNLTAFRGKTIKINYRYNQQVLTNADFYTTEWQRVPELLKQL
jgi:5'(3')-deoxyribonucleotidase